MQQNKQESSTRARTHTYILTICINMQKQENKLSTTFGKKKENKANIVNRNTSTRAPAVIHISRSNPPEMRSHCTLATTTTTTTTTTRSTSKFMTNDVWCIVSVLAKRV